MYIQVLDYFLPGEIADAHLDVINTQISSLNAAIITYNGQFDREKAIESLKIVYQLYLFMSYRCPQPVVSASLKYDCHINNQLFSEIQQACSELGCCSVRALYMSDPTARLDDGPGSLPEILENMSPMKTTHLLEILSAGAMFDSNQLNDLYLMVDPDYPVFRAFLNDHSIQFLGGTNSLNFKITSKIDGSVQVLKVENRFYFDKVVEMHLRKNSLQEVMSHIMAERQATCLLNGEVITRNLLITEYMAMGDLNEYSVKYASDDEGRMNSAIYYFQEMISILENIAYRDMCFFPDMKLNNWMVDENGRLRIADGKSFMSADKYIADEYSVEFQSLLDKGCLTSRHMYPVEFRNLPNGHFDIDEMHAFLLGKALYQYLTNCDCYDLEKIVDRADFDFSSPIFMDKKGKDMALLISDLVREEPFKRITLAEASTRLGLISGQEACRRIVQAMMSYAISADDKLMEVFTMSLDNDIDNLEDCHQCELYQTVLQLFLDSMARAKPIIDQVQASIDWHKTVLSDFKKGDRIAKTLLSIPVPDREFIYQPHDSGPCYELYCLLNPHYSEDSSISDVDSANEVTIAPDEELDPIEGEIMCTNFNGVIHPLNGFFLGVNIELPELELDLDRDVIKSPTT